MPVHRRRGCLIEIERDPWELVACTTFPSSAFGTYDFPSQKAAP